MINHKTLNAKKCEYSDLAIDESLFDRLPRIMDDYLTGRFTHRVTVYRSRTGAVEQQAWVASSGDWNLELGAYRDHDGFFVAVLADPQLRREVWSIAKLLSENGAVLQQGIDPTLPCPT